MRTAVMLALLVGIAMPAGAQDSTTVLPTASPVEIPERAVLVVDSSAIMVGGSFRIVGGSTDDPVGQEGGAAVLTMALNRVLAGSLSGVGGSASATVDREAITIRFLSAPEVWRTTTELVLQTVFSSLPLAIVERARADHAQRLRFEAGAPVRDFQERRFAALFGTTSAWARPTRGTQTSVDAVDLEEIRTRLDDAQLVPSSFAALVGPIDARVASEVLEDFRDAGPTVSPGRLTRTRAWDDGFSEWIPSEITSVWVSIAFPALSDVRRDRLSLLAHHVHEYLTPIPSRPGIVAPQVEVVEALRGPVLMVTFAVAPESAEQWAVRVSEVVRLERDAPPDERFFAWQRRRFRTASRLERASVDERAGALARERSVGLTEEAPNSTESIQLSDLTAVVGSLGPARIILYGPAMSDR